MCPHSAPRLPPSFGDGHLGSTWANLGPTWANLDPTWANLDPAWANLRFSLSFIDFVGFQGVLSEQMCLKYRACAENLATRNSPADQSFPAETGLAEQNRPYVPRAGGQDDGSLPKLPQINIFS